jgi:addiction module HigA family antidote
MNKIAPPPIHPGEVLRKALTDNDITQETLADALNVSRYSVNQIVNAKRNITTDMALRLAKALSSSAEFWLNLQRQYDLWDAYRGIEFGSPIRVLVKPKTE